MPTAQRTRAGEALRAMLPAGTDPYAMVQLASETAFLVRDRETRPGIADVVRSDPNLAAALITTLAALVDVDDRPASMLRWLGSTRGAEQETARMIAALAEARAEYDEAANDGYADGYAAGYEVSSGYGQELPDTLPPVTFESIRELAHAARIARVSQPCGTVGGWSRHMRKKQKPCGRCSQARTVYDNATPEQIELLKTPLTGGNHPPAAAPKCGTVAGYDAHQEFGEKPCRQCLQAAADVVRKSDAAERARTALKPPVTRSNCGSHSGYNRHKAHHEDACEPCRAAQKTYDDERYRRKLERQGKAPKRVAEVHPFPAAADVADQQAA